MQDSNNKSEAVYNKSEAVAEDEKRGGKRREGRSEREDGRKGILGQVDDPFMSPQLSTVLLYPPALLIM